MADIVKEHYRVNPIVMIRDAFSRCKERARHLNASQKKLLLGMIFFLFINAVILAVSVVVFSMLMRKL